MAMMVALSGPAQASDTDFDGLLSAYLSVGQDGVNRVDYGRWKTSAKDIRHLDTYIGELSRRMPSRMQPAEAFAYWANLYNAITVKVVLTNYPVASIRDIKSDNFFDPKAYLGPWRTKRVNVEGRAYSLDDIEHGVLRSQFKDPRVHYAVNCASIGCPNLRLKAWRADTLDVELDNAARAYVNHPRGVTVLAGNALRVSSIYKWFAVDFGGDDERLIAHLRKYAGPELATALAKRVRVAEELYDWSLNDVRVRAGK